VIFTGLTFWVFFAFVLIVYWSIKERRWQNAFLLLASYLFYGWVTPWLAFLLGISTLADFLLDRGIYEKPARTRLFMGVSLLINLGVLAFFKYYNFFSIDLAKLADTLGFGGDFLLVKVFLPAGLSFFTLKKLGYMIDVSRGTLQPTYTLVDFALYVAFFPQIVAGPIDRPQKLLPQIESQRKWNVQYLFNSWPLLIMGLFKKVVIADSVKVIVDHIYSLNQPTLLLLSMGALAFTLQILADFSGYTDIARGLALLLGFDTTENFNFPYLALTPGDFWNRWHITLSVWLRDYIFFPIRRELMRSHIKFPQWLVITIPPIVTMLVSGLWHGAGWTYIVWGLYYGVLISAYQLVGIRNDVKPKSHIMTGVAWSIMFCFIVFGWAIFRAPSLNWLFNIFWSFQLNTKPDENVIALITLAITIFYSTPLVIKMLADRYLTRDSFLHAVYYALAVLAIAIYINSSSPDFIYFKF
jgi:D-alanyl-lipoteichoic acid acyltransferase DltB (MBOAT superfamily)